MSTTEMNRETQKSQLAMQARQAIYANNFDDALTAYKQYIKLDPEDFHGYDGLANALHLLMRVDDERKVRQHALLICEKTLSKDPENISTLQNKAHLLAHFGKVEEALGVYEQILTVDNRNWMAIRQKGMLLMQVGRVTEAAPYIAKAQLIETEVRERLLQRQVQAESKR